MNDGLGLHDEFLTLMQGRGTVEPDEDRLEDGIAFAGVARFPARVKCALLGWSAFKDAVLQAQGARTARRTSHDASDPLSWCGTTCPTSSWTG